MTDTQNGGGVSRRNFLAAAGAVGTVGVAGCTSNPGSGSGNSGELTGSVDIAGSSTVFPLAVAMRKRFVEKHPKVDISVKSTGSGGGFANYFCPGETDFNNASRPIKQAEKQQCANNGVSPVEMKVATDALTVVVNPKADWFKDGDCITVEQLAEIWSPESKPTKWSDVNSEWPDENIQLFGPTDASGTYDYFTEVIVGEEGASRSDYQATEQDNQIINGVAQNEYAMGYLGFAYYTENKDRVKALAVDNGDGCVKPSIETAKSGEYAPLSRPLFTYAAKSSLSEDQVAEFAKYWIEQSTSQKIVAQSVGYIPNSEAEKEEAMKRLQTAIDEANSN
ncbi:phosphate ABC transporter substrate-binding protein PstS family protein [Halobaculum sp. D14]|uniref:PstS family phosphate ABC transporter substrate-binding protein n=1 Tax=unclassified Halobaculum TaxID=2640896 RepID=UPI003EBFFF3F